MVGKKIYTPTDKSAKDKNDIVFAPYQEKVKISGISLQCQLVTSPTHQR
jgi:hypothetical protein